MRICVSVKNIGTAPSHRPLTSRRIRLASMRSSKARGIFLIATFSFRTSSFAELERREREAGGQRGEEGGGGYAAMGDTREVE